MKQTITRWICSFLLATTTILSSGCATPAEPPQAPGTEMTTDIPAGEAVVSDTEMPEMPTDAVRSGSSLAADCEILLSDTDTQIKGKGAAFADGVLTISAPGSYLLSGTLSNGQIGVDTGKSDAVTLLFDGLSVTNPTGSALLAASGTAPLTISLPAGSVNVLAGTNTATDSGSDENETKAALFAKCGLTITGDGTLAICADGCKGIFSKDDLLVEGGELLITADDDGLRGKNSVTVNGVSLSLSVGGDGIHTDSLTVKSGTVSGSTGEDGLDAVTATVEGGTITLRCGGGSNEIKSGGDFGGRFGGGDFGGGRGGFDRGGRSERPDMPPDRSNKQGGETIPFTEAKPTEANNLPESGETSGGKGLKADESIFITGGNITLDCADDTIHSNGDFRLTGGTLLLSSSDDGIHADRNLVIDGGTVTISRSMEGVEGQFITLNDGTVEITAADDGFNAVDNSESEETDTNTDTGRDIFGGRFGGFGGMGGMGNTSTNCSLTLAGGSCTVNAGGDGLDSNGSIYQTGGKILVFGPTDNGNGAIDYGDGRDCCYEISGGTLLAVGSSGMAQVAENKGQAVISGKLQSVSANSVLSVSLSGSDRAIFSTSLPKAISHIVFSSPDLIAGERYTLTVDGETHATLQAK